MNYHGIFASGVQPKIKKCSSGHTLIMDKEQLVTLILVSKVWRLHTPCMLCSCVFFFFGCNFHVPVPRKSMMYHSLLLTFD